jgi:hypothetical protein
MEARMDPEAFSDNYIEPLMMALPENNKTQNSKNHEYFIEAFCSIQMCFNLLIVGLFMFAGCVSN